MVLFFLLLGLIFLAIALSALRRYQAHSSSSSAGILILFCLSYLSGGFGLAVWPTTSGIFIDHAFHTVGLGHLFSEMFVTMCFVCQFAFVSVLTGIWSRRHRLAIAVYGGLIVLLIVLWVVLLHTSGIAVQGMFYDGYLAHPLPVFLWNLTVGTCTIYAALLCLIGYVGALVADATSVGRVTAYSAIVVSGGAAAYGLLVLAQVWTNLLGAHAATTVLFHLRLPLLVLSSGLGMLATWAITNGRPVWTKIQLRRQIWAQCQSVRALVDAMITANLFISNCLLRMQPHTRPDALAYLIALCNADHWPCYWTDATTEALRWIIWRRACLLDGPWPEQATNQTRAIDDMIASDARHRREWEHGFYADAFDIVSFSLSRERRHIPNAGQPDQLNWIATAGSLITSVLNLDGANQPRPADHSGHILVKRGPVPSIQRIMKGCMRVTTRFLQTNALVGDLALLRAELAELQSTLIATNVFLGDRLVLLLPYTNWALMSETANLCDMQGLPPYWSEVAIEVVRWLSWDDTGICESEHQVSNAEWRAHQLRRISVLEAALKTTASTNADRETQFIADVARTVMLVTTSQWLHRPVWQDRSITIWHRQAASIVATTFKNHQRHATTAHDRKQVSVASHPATTENAPIRKGSTL